MLLASFLVWITYGAFTAVEIVYVRDVLGVSMAAFAVIGLQALVARSSR